MEKIPVIDLFAGPGGLGEGFCRYQDIDGENPFDVSLSIEQDRYAHTTLLLRSFVNQFDKNELPDDYFRYLKGEIKIESLFEEWPEQYHLALRRAWKARLGTDQDSESNQDVDERIRIAIGGSRNWVLLGGPPCQAYSVVGRSRRKEKVLNEQDERVGLYKQYLRIIAIHNPSVFVMENVPGLLSAQTDSNRVFSKILDDLRNPLKAHDNEYGTDYTVSSHSGYKIYSLEKASGDADLFRGELKHKDYIVKAEKHGIPQTRHRVILLGIRDDINYVPETLTEKPFVPVEQVLNGLPAVRSTLSRQEDSYDNWLHAIKGIMKKSIRESIDTDVSNTIDSRLSEMVETSYMTGGEFMASNETSVAQSLEEWFENQSYKAVLNHTPKKHMKKDLLRYFFIACFGEVKNRSPKLDEFPEELLPAHKNVKAGVSNQKFADRFTVQLAQKPGRTITSHIAKDGHYYIHPDPRQCRSFTVREAARIQTFPDDFFFCGPRTSQFHQVGNAVPPLLASKIAAIVFGVFRELDLLETSVQRKLLNEN